MTKVTREQRRAIREAIVDELDVLVENWSEKMTSGYGDPDVKSFDDAAMEEVARIAKFLKLT